MGAAYVLGKGRKSLSKPRGKAAKQRKVHKVMSEFKRGKLHSGSKHGPEVKNRRQAVAIALSEANLSNKK